MPERGEHRREIITLAFLKLIQQPVVPSRHGGAEIQLVLERNGDGLAQLAKAVPFKRRVKTPDHQRARLRVQRVEDNRTHADQADVPFARRNVPTEKTAIHIDGDLDEIRRRAVIHPPCVGSPITGVGRCGDFAVTWADDPPACFRQCAATHAWGRAADLLQQRCQQRVILEADPHPSLPALRHHPAEHLPPCRRENRRIPQVWRAVGVVVVAYHRVADALGLKLIELPGQALPVEGITHPPPEWHRPILGIRVAKPCGRGDISIHHP